MSTSTLGSNRRALLLVALLVALVVAPTSRASSPTAPADGASHPAARASAKAERMERKVRACTNRRRRSHGTGTLAPSKPLTQAANLLASDMRRHGYFGHIDHEGRDVGDRVAMFASSARYQPLGENIAAGYGPKGACKAWMDSSAHRANMLDGKYNVIGVGFAHGGEYGSYFVQVFGRGPRK